MILLKSMEIDSDVDEYVKPLSVIEEKISEVSMEMESRQSEIIDKISAISIKSVQVQHG